MKKISVIISAFIIFSLPLKTVGGETDSVEIQVRAAYDVVKNGSKAYRAFGWLALSRALKSAKESADLSRELLTEIERAALKENSTESTLAHESILEFYPKRRLNWIVVYRSPAEKEENVRGMMTAMAAERRKATKDAPSFPAQIVDEKKNPGSREINTLLGTVLKRKLDQYQPEQLTLLGSLLRGNSSALEKPIPAEYRNWFRYAAALGLSVSRPVVKEAWGVLGEAGLYALLNECASNGTKNPVSSVLANSCREALAEMRKQDVADLNVKAMMENIKKDARVDGILAKKTLGHHELKVGVTDKSVLESDGIAKIDFSKVNELQEGDVKYYCYGNSIHTQDQKCGYSFESSVEIIKDPTFGNANHFRYTKYMTMQGTGKMEVYPVIRFGHLPAKETNFVALRLDLFRNYDFAETYEITCESGCVTKTRMGAKNPMNWAAFPIFPGVPLEFAITAVKPADGIHYKQAGVVTAGTNEKKIPRGWYFDTVLFELDAQVAARSPVASLLEIDRADPKPSDKPQYGKAVVAYLLSVQKALADGEWLFPNASMRVSENAALGLARLSVLHELVRLPKPEKLPAIIVKYPPGSPASVGTKPANEEHPFIQIQAVLATSFPLIAKRIADHFQPQLERELLLLSRTISSVSAIQVDLEKATKALNTISRDDKWTLLSRSAKTLKVENPEVLENQEYLNTGIIGASERTLLTLTQLKSQMVLGCDVLKRFELKLAAPMPSIEVSEDLKEVCAVK